MSFAAAERATTQPDATTDRAANALRQLLAHRKYLRACVVGDRAGEACSRVGAPAQSVARLSSPALRHCDGCH